VKQKAYQKVSIILPTYNRAEFIFDTIKSILDQTYSNWELLVLDDGSTDRTIELFSENIFDNRITLYKCPFRQGITGIRNLGLSKASGELIAFIDSDDLWESTKLEKQVQSFTEFPEAGYGMTGGYNFKEKNTPLEFFYKQRDGIRYENLFISFFKSEVTAITSTLIFKRKSIEKIGNFTEKIVFPDLEFMLRLAHVYKGIILYEPLVFRRIHDSNISTEEWVKGYREGIRMITMHKNVLPSAVTKKALFRLYMNAGEKYLAYQEKMSAILHFLKAWRHQPLSGLPVRKTSKAILQLFKK